MRIPYQTTTMLMIPVVALITLSGCQTEGGNGLGNLFSGSSKQATVGKANAKAFFSGSKKGNQSSSMIGALSKFGGGSVGKLHAKLDAPLSNETAQMPMQYKGDCGGSMSFSITQGDNEGSYDFKVNFDKFCTWYDESQKQKEVQNGFVTMKADGDKSIDITLDLAVTNPEEDSKTVGQMGMKSLPNDVSEISMSMEYADAKSKQSSKFENFKLTQSPNSLAMSGRFYDEDNGFVELETKKPLKYDSAGVPNEGEMIVRGDKSSATMTFNGPNYTIAIDEDGDGKAETTESGMSSEFKQEKETGIANASAVESSEGFDSQMDFETDPSADETELQDSEGGADDQLV